MTAYTIARNEQFNSIEISFAEKPCDAIRDALKGLKFRWHGVKKVWYGYTTEEAARAAIEGKEPEKPAKDDQPAKVEKANKYGVKVGDIFEASWGYDQTNVDFFQVVALCGEQSVRVRGVQPRLIEEDAVSGMSSDRTYAITNEILPPRSNVFIKDNEKGDLKRLNGKKDSGVYIRIDSFALAYKVEGDKIKCYESWYA